MKPTLLQKSQFLNIERQRIIGECIEHQVGGQILEVYVVCIEQSWCLVDAKSVVTDGTIAHDE